jgi:hypothetical protein
MKKILITSVLTLFCIGVFAVDPSKWTDEEIGGEN